MRKMIMAGAGLLCALAAWQLWPNTSDASAAMQNAGAGAGAGADASKQHQLLGAAAGGWFSSLANAESKPEELKRVPLLPVGFQMSATQSLVDTRDGDARTPPIARDTQAPQAAAAAELADPQAYQRYEARQNMRLYSSFVQQAELEVPRLKADVARGIELGIAPDKIAVVQDKIKRLEAMQTQLKHDHPELNAAPNAP